MERVKGGDMRDNCNAVNNKKKMNLNAPPFLALEANDLNIRAAHEKDVGRKQQAHISMVLGTTQLKTRFIILGQ